MRSVSCDKMIVNHTYDHFMIHVSIKSSIVNVMGLVFYLVTCAFRSFLFVCLSSLTIDHVWLALYVDLCGAIRVIALFMVLI